jgi:nitronate monooxygenase
LAPDAHKHLIVSSTLDDVVLTSAITGLPTSMLRGSLEAVGIDLAALKAGTADLAAVFAEEGGRSPWRDLYSAGHSASGVDEVTTVAGLVERSHEEFRSIPPRGVACGAGSPDGDDRPLERV